MSLILPSYQSGFAPRDYEPAYPSLWQGCVGAWAPLLGPTGLVLRDSVGGNHGTLTNGPTWQISGGKYALDFDGVNDNISFPDKASLVPSTITFAAWIKRPSDWNITGSCIFWAKPNAAFDGNGFYIEPNTPSFSNNTLVVTNGAATSYLRLNQAGNTSFPLNTWTHFAFWIQGSSGQFYLNGLPVSTTAVGSLTITGTNDAKYLFVNSPGYGNYTPGQIDDLRIYSRRLSESEIRILASRRGIGYDYKSHRSYSKTQSSGLRKKILTGLP